MPVTLAQPQRLDRSGAPRAAPPGLSWQNPVHALHQRDIEFVALKLAYRTSGGIGCGESMALRMSLTGTGGYVDLARRVVARQLFSFQWNDQFWLPMFQFDPVLLTQREAPRRVLDELDCALDGWAIAHWYVTPSAALGRQRPLDLLDTQLPAVLAAARAAGPAARAWRLSAASATAVRAPLAG